jgi:hypothetical protein
MFISYACWVVVFGSTPTITKPPFGQFISRHGGDGYGAPETCEAIGPEPTDSRTGSDPSMALLLRWMNFAVTSESLVECVIKTMESFLLILRIFWCGIYGLVYWEIYDSWQFFLLQPWRIEGLKETRKYDLKETTVMARNTSYFCTHNPIYGMYNPFITNYNHFNW